MDEIYSRELDKIVSEADILVVGIGSPNFVKVQIYSHTRLTIPFLNKRLVDHP